MVGSSFASANSYFGHVMRLNHGNIDASVMTGDWSREKEGKADQELAELITAQNGLDCNEQNY